MPVEITYNLIFQNRMQNFIYTFVIGQISRDAIGSLACSDRKMRVSSIKQCSHSTLLSALHAWLKSCAFQPLYMDA